MTARISEADAARLGIGRAPGRGPSTPAAKGATIPPASAPAKRRRKPKAEAGAPSVPGSGRNRAARLASPGAAVEIALDLPFDPRPKGRPRTVPNLAVYYAAVGASRGSVQRFREALAADRRPKTQTYTPDGTAEYESLLKSAVAAAMLGRAPFACPVEMDLRLVLAGDPGVWPTSALDGDADNLEKAVLDAMNGIVFEDDRLVVRSSRIKECGPVARVVATVRPAAP